jgi:hypothetical protein
LGLFFSLFKKKTIAISFIKYLGIIIIQVYMENNNVLLECMNEVEIHFLPLPWNIRKKTNSLPSTSSVAGVEKQ